MTATIYHLTATVIDHNGVEIDSNNAETLGEFYGREFADLGDAQEFAGIAQSEAREHEGYESVIVAVATR